MGPAQSLLAAFDGGVDGAAGREAGEDQDQLRVPELDVVDVRRMFTHRSVLLLCLGWLLLSVPAFARGRDVNGHYERNGENEQASLDVTMLSGERVKVSGIALW